MKLNIFIVSVILGFILCAMVPMASSQTTLQVCHTGGPRVHAVIYETYNGLFQEYKVSGWYTLKDRGCVRELLTGRDIRSFAFAAINESGQLVALPFEYNISKASFRGSVKSICIPVTEEFEAFEITSKNQEGVTAPCQDGHTPLTTSFSILGGTVDQTIRLGVSGLMHLPPPDPAYARVWEEQFGVAAEDAAAAQKQRQVDAREELRRRRRSETFILQELDETCGAVNAETLESVHTVPHLPGLEATVRPANVFDLSCGTGETGWWVRKFNKPSQGWRKIGDHPTVCETHSNLVFLKKEEEMLEKFSLRAKNDCDDLVDSGSGLLARTVRQLIGTTEDYESCLAELEKIEQCQVDLVSSRKWIWEFFGIETQ